MKKLPFLITIPHGGTRTPEELKDAVCITAEDLFDDSDSFTDRIYSVADQVEAEIKFDIARAFIDVNRAEDDLPPENPDGVIKDATCYNRPIYKVNHKPDDALTERLLSKYYRPFHVAVDKALKNPAVKIALDCHSMATVAPAIAPDAGRRPLFNLGDLDGEACDQRITQLLKESFIEVFDLGETDVAINQPFKGGYITRTYGNKPKPWIQIEMNRSLYLTQQWFDATCLEIESKRLEHLNKTLLNVMRSFEKRIVEHGFL